MVSRKGILGPFVWRGEKEVGVREWEWARGDGVGEKKASGLKVAVLGGGW